MAAGTIGPMTNRWWMRPWALALVAGLAVLVAAFVPPLLQALRAPPPAEPPGHGLPWQVERTPDGTTRVFGLALGRSTLADVERDGALQVAVVGLAGEAGALEGYLDAFNAGFVVGRLVLAADASEAQRRAWQQRATRREGGGASLRYVLAGADRAEALRAAVVGLTFIPNAQLDAPTLRQRFGEPTQRIAAADGRLEHWLYPALGLAIVLDAEGRDVLQYVAPADFDAKLRAPLLAAR
jgi:hypothetical protein